MNLSRATSLLSRKQIRSIAESSDARISCWTGAVRSGKTIASLIAFLITVADAAPQGLILIVGRTLQTIERNVIEPLQDSALFGIVAGQVHHTRGSTTAVILGRTVHLIGASDARAEGRIRGLTAYLAYVDEATLVPESSFNQLLARLSVPNARLIATTNPDGPAHWLRKNFLLRTGLNLASWHFTLDDNPALDPSYVASLKQEYVGLWYRRFIEGEWCLAEGAVYDMWDEGRHVVRELPQIVSWLALGIDVGTTNPTAAVLLGLGADRRLYAAAEWRWDSKQKRKQLTDVQQSQAIREWLSTLTISGVQGARPEYTVVDPAAASMRAQLYHDGLVTTAAANEVLDGIRTVSSLLGAGKLRIHASCKGLIDEMTGYSWDDKAAAKGEDKPLKVDDHSCFVAGTLVQTVDGERPIELIRPGDEVLTRKGRKPVTGSGMTDASAVVHRVDLDDGRSLTGTGNHPVWVEGHGWKRLDSLRYADKLFSWQNESIPLSSKASGSADTPTPTPGLKAPTTSPASRTVSAAPSACTKRSGWPPTVEQPPRATTSTTQTGIRSTTILATSHVSPPTSIALTMEINREANARSNGGPNVSAGLLPGTAAERAVLGTLSTAYGLGTTGTLTSAHATAAGAPMAPAPGMATNGSAPTLASPQPGEHPASMMSPAHASAAGQSSPPTGTPRSGSAGSHVLRVTAMPEKRAVWNLTVADCPEYYAQGVLVHNCDALRYATHTTRALWRPHIALGGEHATA